MPLELRLGLQQVRGGAHEEGSFCEAAGGGERRVITHRGQAAGRESPGGVLQRQHHWPARPAACAACTARASPWWVCLMPVWGAAMGMQGTLAAAEEPWRGRAAPKSLRRSLQGVGAAGRRDAVRLMLDWFFCRGRMWVCCRWEAAALEGRVRRRSRRAPARSHRRVQPPAAFPTALARLSGLTGRATPALRSTWCAGRRPAAA